MEKRIAYILYKMIGLIVLIGLVSAWQWDFIAEGVMAHVYTTGSILSAFGFAIVMAFIFVAKLKNEVIAFNALKEMWDDIRIGRLEQSRDPLWRHYRCSRPGRLFKRPRLLGHAYDLVTEELARTKKIRLSVETMNTLVHKISQTIDDEKSLLGYMSGLLVFMGLIGTFIGLLHMVGSMGGIIGELASSAGGSASPDAFQKLLGALQEPLKGMASGFAASLFGLFSSLIVGLLARMAGQAAGVLKHEFEAWLAGVVQIGDDEYGNDSATETAGVARHGIDRALVQTVGSILEDYSRVASTFDQAVRLLHDIQVSQQRQETRIDTIADGLSRFGAGMETLSEEMSAIVATELTATRAMMREMEQSHSVNVRSLANNHAQTAVQLAAAIERSASVAEQMPMQVHASIESRVDDAVKDAMQPIGMSVSQQMHRLESAVAQLNAQPAGRDAWSQERNEASDHLENRISNGFDSLNQNITAAFSAYSGVLKLAVTALEKHDVVADRTTRTPAVQAQPMNSSAAG
ncbi:MAG: hypothetical protein ABW213_11875 [Tardiphaga sp.]